MKTLLITDLHFTDRPQGLLAEQRDCIIKIFKNEKPDDVIIMGDLMMHRKPSPSVLLALKSVVDFLQSKKIPLTIIRGNHDSETRSDNGVTALSLFNYHANVVSRTWFDYKTKRAYIPHYENENTILRNLTDCPGNYTVFGHFGYMGCLNSRGDADFSITLDKFRCRTYLGHIHKFRQDGFVTILGTPYSTNFGEAQKQCYYGVLVDGKEEFKSVSFGPRHLVVKRKSLDEPDMIKFINNTGYYTLLRILMDSTDVDIPYDKLDVAHIDVKYNPSFDEDHISNYSPKRDLFKLNEVIIEDYVDSANTDIPKESIMDGLRLLKDED